MKLTFFLFLSSFFCIAQSSRNWQQEVNYSINVTLDDVNHAISGDEEIIYINNSPLDLDTLVFHLWPNGYRSQNTALAKQHFRLENEAYHLLGYKKNQGYIDSLDFKVNEERIKWFLDDAHQDICYLVLNEPIKSGESIRIYTPFFVKIPNAEISRLGHINQSYQITQWYPKPAVYDHNGWNPMPYINYGEFYSEYGSFDVNITLPANYRVGATGDLVGPYASKELSFLDSIAEVTSKIEYFDQTDLSFPVSSNKTKTLHYYQKNVHDFAWFADKRYHVLKGQVELPYSKEKVNTWAMFTNNEAHLWKKSITYLNQSVYDYSLWNGDYPYKHASAVDGTISAGGGMEYPNVTVIGESGDDISLELVIAHEVGHNWFYGILGSNEREYAWMDEGINSYNEKRYLRKHHPELGLLEMYTGRKGTHFAGKRIPSYDEGYFVQPLFMMRSGHDQAIETHSNHLTELNYGLIVYSKAAAAFQYLADFLGQDIFDECMQEYFKTWKYRHPQPNDIKALFEKVSQKDLSWFFIDLIKTDKFIDYKIHSYELNDSSIHVVVSNKGEIKAPFSVTFYKSGIASDKYWFEGFSDKTILEFEPKDFDKIVINADLETTELYRHNNRIKASGLFKKAEPVKLSFVGSIEDRRQNEVYWSPTIGWNQLDGLMIGAAAFNTSVMHKKFNWHVMPLYGTKSNQILGSTSLQYNIFKPFKKSNKISLSSELRRYSLFSTYNEDILDNELYNRIKNSIKINLQSSPTSLGKHKVYLNHYYFDQRIASVSLEENQNLFKFRYEFKRKSLLQNQMFNLDFDIIDDFNRLHFTYTNKIHYSNKAKLKDKFFYLRIFGGTLLDNDNGDSRYQLRLTGLNASQDIFMDELFLNRASRWNNALANQMIMADGGFATKTSIGYSNWMLSANLKTDLPPLSHYGFFRLSWLRPYMNVAVFRNFNGESLLANEFGLNIKIIKDYFELYYPITASEEIRNNYELNFPNAHPLHKIRFTLNLNAAKLYKFVDRFNE